MSFLILINVHNLVSVFIQIFLNVSRDVKRAVRRYKPDRPNAAAAFFTTKSLIVLYTYIRYSLLIYYSI